MAMMVMMKMVMMDDEDGDDDDLIRNRWRIPAAQSTHHVGSLYKLLLKLGADVTQDAEDNNKYNQD